MNVKALAGPDTGPPLGRSRARVLNLLRAAGTPLEAREIADRTGLHPNTARFHLDGLAAAGLAARERRPRRAPGRPGVAYRAAGGGGPSGGRRYPLLAEMLASLVADVLPEPGPAAVAAGREWGAYLTPQPPPYQRLGTGEAIERLAAVLEKLAFAPQAAADGGQRQMCLRQCPFREVAQRHQDVVCSLHLGLMQGVLARLRAPVTVDRLEPFAGPSLCVTHLSAREEPSRASPPAGPPGR